MFFINPRKKLQWTPSSFNFVVLKVETVQTEKKPTRIYKETFHSSRCEL